MHFLFCFKNRCLLWNVTTHLTISIHCLEWELTWRQNRETTSKSSNSNLQLLSCLIPQSRTLCNKIFKLYPPSSASEKKFMVISKSYWCSKTFHQLKKKLRVICRSLFLLRETQVYVNRSHVRSLSKLGTSKHITDFQWVNHLMQEWGDGIIIIQSS